MNGTWFSPVANKTSETLGIPLDEANWLGNVIFCTTILVSPLVPIFCPRSGLPTVVGHFPTSWVRHAGKEHSVPVPKYSETWFDTKDITAVRMLVSVSNPV
ncbi:hypothetical protein ACEPAF_1353 [Sanghuangporus sanghuang]